VKIGLMVPLPGDLPTPATVVAQIVRAGGDGLPERLAPNVRGDALTA
jgi:hypothetical protein